MQALAGEAGQDLSPTVVPLAKRPLPWPLAPRHESRCFRPSCFEPGAEEFLLWPVFAAVMACGLSTILQVMKVGRIGADYLLPHGTCRQSAGCPGGDLGPAQVGADRLAVRGATGCFKHASGVT